MPLERAALALRQGNSQLAASLCAALVANYPGLVAAWRLLGAAATRLKDFELAARAYGESIRHEVSGSPDQVADLLARAEPLICLGRPAEAFACVREALPGLTTPDDYSRAALAFSHLGLPTRALPLAEKAVELAPALAEAWFLVGNSRQFLGDVDIAERAFKRVIELSRDHSVAAYHSLAHLRRWTRETNRTRELESFQCRTSAEASRIGYALFKEYDDIGDTDAAWDCLQHGARAARSLEQWDDAAERKTFEAWQAAFPSSPTVGDTRRRSGPKRIFIVGLPRSGTTLVERILASHSSVQSIGEVNTFAIAVRRLSGVESPDIVNPRIISAAKSIDPLAIAEAYSADVAYLSDGSAYAIDKRPDNFQYLGLIKRAYPDALLILLERDPMDALFGAYKRSFAPGAHGWSYTFADLAAHYRNFASLTAHWKKVLGDDLIEISLESLIADPAGEIRRLLSRCNLPIEDACLTPHLTKGAVATASALQVRQPINRDGVGAWKRYGAQLAPLQDLLRSTGKAA
jgi:tetratricopeptide (TPR) repeat protein